MRRAAAIAVMATLMSMGAAAPSSAHATRYPSDVAATHYGEDELSGVVSAGQAKPCYGGRSIMLYGPGGDLVGSTVSESNAGWSMGATLEVGVEYRLELRRKVVRRSGRHRHVCGPGEGSVEIVAPEY